jgi:alkaline phosphatase D
VLWTRIDSLTEEEPKLATVELALDHSFSEIVAHRQVSAWGAYDYCVKVRVDGLEPYTTYFYRFVYGQEVSPVGRTKTAPAPDSDQTVRFGVVYCQDYIGRYYNAYLKMLLDHDGDIDFVVFLGDYVYETTGDPVFQDPSGERFIEFQDIDGAIPLGGPNYAAASLSNYRTLYRTYRTDLILQQVHERWPMIVIWDDHEFSNDSWGANATYTNGRWDELEQDRRRNAEQAFFEWIPTEIGLDDQGELAIDTSMLFPNSRIYRDYQFGANLHLVLTDYRTYRPDHLVPEDAFPGAIALEEGALRDLLGDQNFYGLRLYFDPYLDLDWVGLGILKNSAILVAAGAYRQENPALDMSTAIALAKEQLNGNVSATYLSALFAAVGLQSPLNQQFLEQLPRGISYLYLGKQSIYSSTGSRYLLLNDTYNLLALYRYLASNGELQNALGGQQEAWLSSVLYDSQATWKVLGSSVSMAPMVIDFTNPQLAAMLPPGFPDMLRTRLKLNVDQWDGFPEKRAELLGLLATIENPVVISGDIHATFVTDHGAGVFELTGPAISSSTFGSIVAGTVASDPTLGQVPGMDALVAYLPTLLQVSAMDDEMVSASDILYTTTDRHGYTIVEVDSTAMTATIQEIAEAETFTSYYNNPDAVRDLFVTSTYTIENGVLTPGPREEVVPRYEPTTCKHELLPDSTTECGYLIVPENRNDPDSREIKVYIGNFRNPNGDTGTEPLIYLIGGPGSATAAVYSLFENPAYGFRNVLGDNRDLIIIDQRGTNYSEPALFCSAELEPLRDQVYGLAYRDAADRRVAGIGECRERLLAQGIDLSGYTTYEIAADVRDLRDLLGYEKVSLYGASYGTRLAMMIMKLYPEILETVVIDSILPPELNPFIEETPGTQFGFDRFFEAAGNDYPEVEDFFWETVDRLANNPVDVAVNGTVVNVTGVKLVSYMAGRLRKTPYDNALPMKIYDMYNNENYDDVATEWVSNIDFFFPMGGAGGDAVSVGMFESVFGANDAFYATPDDVLEEIAATVDNPSLASWLATNFIYMEPCILGEWPVEPLPQSARDPVVSNLPTLMLVGTLDVATPAIFSEPSVDDLSNSHYFEILAGHATAYLPCVLDMVNDFIKDPTVAPINTCATEYCWDTETVTCSSKSLWSPPLGLRW